MALGIRSHMVNASDDVVYNVTKAHHARRKTYCSYGKGRYFIQEKNNLMKRDTFKYSGTRTQTISVGRTKSMSKQYHEIPKVFTLNMKPWSKFRNPRDNSYSVEIPAKWGPKWRKRRLMKKTDIGEDGKLKKGLHKVHDKKTGKDYVEKGQFRNYQQEFIRRAVYNNTQGAFYRGNLARAATRKIWKHLQLDAMKKKRRRAAAKYYDAWRDEEEDEKKTKKSGSKTVNNEDLVEVD